MTFLELMERIECNVLSDESILNMFEIFIKNKDIGTTRMYSFKTDKKAGDTETIDHSEIIAYRIDLIKEYLNAMYIDKCNGKLLGQNGEEISKDTLARLKLLTDEQLIDICLNGNQSILGSSVILDIYNNQTDFDNEHNGRGSYLIDGLESGGIVAGTKRIYLNSPNSIERYKFLYLFIKECIRQRIPFDMKGSGTYIDSENKDRTILYSDEENFLKHISIVDIIMKENPDIEASFGSPIISGGRVKNERGESKYAITSCAPLGQDKATTHNSYFDICLKTAMISFLSEKLLEENIILENIDLKYFSQIEKMWLDGKTNMDRKLYLLLYEKGIEILQRDGISQKDLNKLRENIKKTSSYLRFKDFSHTEVPIYMDKIFYEQFSQIKIQEDSNIKLSADEKPEHIYLFQTESLIDTVLEEFINSSLTNKERAIIYITKVSEIFRKFEVYSKLLTNFRTTPRYLEVQEYLKNIPLFRLYQEDSTKGNGINMILENRYYDEISNQISSFAVTAKSTKKL